MKKNIIILIILLGTIGVWSCNEKEWLKEEPKSFYAPENSYSTLPHFKKALNFLYDYLRRGNWEIGDQNDFLYFADMAYGGTDYPDKKFNNANIWVGPAENYVDTYWQRGYISIANANTIINRLAINNTITGKDKAFIEGEALFFRAFWYNWLANQYGNVPITLDEPTVARDNYVSSPRDSVYDQARKDLERATTLLLDADSVDNGRINRQAAQHLLAEVYISLKDYPKAIQAASAVINHPKMALMTSRFGSRAVETGNPYWDLFQSGNQNRKGYKNTESILVLQFDYNNPGSAVSHQGPRNFFPFYNGVNVLSPAGKEVAAFLGYSEDKGGRGIGVIHPTSYFLDSIWGTDGTNDYRNAPYLIVRDMLIDNPAAAGYGKYLVAGGYLREQYKLRHFYPFIMKFGRTGNLPDDNYLKNTDGSYQKNSLGVKLLNYTSGSAIPVNSSLKDEYLYRLGGTYLLRAEAYIKSNQLGLALNDINALRNRAHATPALLSDMTLDYLMDEQMRELYFEDYRYITLARMGKLVDRMRKHNPMGHNVSDKHNLFPIPASEIERNINGNMPQNPGY